MKAGKLKAVRLWAVLKSLQPKELSVFSNWLTYREAGTETRALFCALTDAALSGETLKQEVWSRLYPGRLYEDGKMRKQFSALLREVEGFLAARILQEQEADREIYALEAHKARKQAAFFFPLFRRIAGRFSAQAALSLQDARRRYHIWRLFREFDLPDPKSAAQNLPLAQTESPFEAGQRAYDHWMMMELITSKLIAISYWQEDPLLHESPLLGLMPWEQLVATGVVDAPLGNIFLRILSLVKTDDFLDADGGIEFLNLTRTRLPADTSRLVFLILLNHHTRLFNETLTEGNLVFVQALYNWGLEEGLLLADNYLHDRHYRNIVTLFLLNKLPETALMYAETLKDLLAPEMRNDQLAFALARCKFAMGAFREVVLFLGAITFRDPLTELQARILLIQAHYERSTSDDYVWLSGLIRQLIRNLKQEKGLPPAQKKGVQQSLRLLDNLMKCEADRCPPALLRKLAQLAAPQLQSWLTEKFAARFSDFAPADA